MIVAIDDPEDARIAAYRDIRERDLVGREGLFVAEGQVVLAMLIASTAYRPQSLLIAAHRVEGLAEMLAKVPREVPIYAARQAVLDGIAGFAIHRGILAIGRRTAVPDAEDMLTQLPDRATVLLLSGIANHDNMGGIFRNAAAFGADAILIDADCCDPLYRKAIRVSVGAVLRVPFATVARDGDTLSLLHRHDFAALALTPAGGIRLADHRPGRRTAVLLGAEGPGLPPHMIEGAMAIRIDMAPGFDSLNVATTSGIVLHHLATHAPS